MKKILIIFFSPLFLFAQEDLHQLTWRSNLIFESNGLNKSFLNSMLYGGFITGDMKSKWIASGDEINIIHAEISNELSYTYNFKKQSVGFSFSDINILNASFKDDLLRIVFEGNFYHQDKTLDVSKTNVRADRFQQYKIRYGNTINNVNINGGISYLAGNHHLSYIVEKGSLYTAPFGSYLDIQYNMNAFITDSSSFSAFANNGNGVAIDCSTHFSIQEYDIHFSVTDLGFIMWGASSIILATDSSFNFQGIEVDNIFNFNDSVLDANNIINDEPITNTKSFKSYIPATFHFSISGETEHKSFKTYTTGVIAKWQPYMDDNPLSFAKINQGFKESNFSPFYYIHTIFNTKYCNIIPKLGYGGYSNNKNIALALSKGKKNKFVIGTNHIEDIFNDTKTINLYFNMRIQF